MSQTRYLTRKQWTFVKAATFVVVAAFMFWVLERSRFNLIVGLFLLIVAQGLYMVARSLTDLSEKATTMDPEVLNSKLNLLFIQSAYLTIAALGVFLVATKES